MDNCQLARANASYRESRSITAALSTTTTTNYTAKQNRGRVKLIDFISTTNNIDTNKLITVTVIADGVEVAKDMNLLDFSPDILQDNSIPIDVKPGGIIDIVITNGNAAAVAVTAKFYYLGDYGTC